MIAIALAAKTADFALAIDGELVDAHLEFHGTDKTAAVELSRVK
ncbi:hypothetical protein [Demequina iriomotensis]|nr:hypothetical protein [Demequina iriomotensis]